MKSALIFLLGACGWALTANAQPRPIQIMLLDGESAGPYHNWQLTTPVLKKELEETGLFDVTVVTAPRSGEDFSGFNPDFAKYRAVVSNLDTPDWPAPLRIRFEEYVKNGGGLVIVHAADNAFPHWTAYNEMIGIGGWRGRDQSAGPMWFFDNGKLVSDTSTPGTASSNWPGRSETGNTDRGSHR